METKAGTVNFKPGVTLAVLHLAGDSEGELRPELRHLVHGRDPVHPAVRRAALLRRRRLRDPVHDQGGRLQLRA